MIKGFWRRGGAQKPFLLKICGKFHIIYFGVAKRKAFFHKMLKVFYETHGGNAILKKL
ncbi:MAG: hypothetical protein ACI4IW_04985 [Oscillospiraceae bacterium]